MGVDLYISPVVNHETTPCKTIFRKFRRYNNYKRNKIMNNYVFYLKKTMTCMIDVALVKNKYFISNILLPNSM